MEARYSDTCGCGRSPGVHATIGGMQDAERAWRRRKWREQKQEQEQEQSREMRVGNLATSTVIVIVMMMTDDGA